MVINRFEVHLVNLDPTVGREVKKTRPCLIISPDEMNHNINTVTKSDHSFINAVINNFKNKMMKSSLCCIPNIHTGSFPDSFDSLENGYLCCIIFAHS